ncbi:Organic cation transporter protein [Araneus ventricosus]|uniref:Organic cation transporter protein n=1 Tax=Araneus ventricosus TaxID=182803 RepID=A0A4Y2HUA4_ARAVE|nr:Organic cation transporter protein [Araneus ventricosus]
MGNDLWGYFASLTQFYSSWFINSYIYYVLSWNTNDLGGDPYWNFFFIGAVEVPEVIIYIFLCRRIGNRRGLAIANVLSGVCLIILVCIPFDKVWLTILFSVCGKFFSSASFDTGFVYTPEIFPTVMRNVALGSSSTMARIGALLAPFVHQLADVTYPWVPMAVPGALSILSGFLVLLLPETKGKTLSDTLT